VWRCFGRPGRRPVAATSPSRPTCSNPADRINVYERWNSQSAVEAFRGGGPSDEQGAATISASVAEFDVAQQRSLT
jgi:hypothetical protein